MSFEKEIHQIIMLVNSCGKGIIRQVEMVDKIEQILKELVDNEIEEYVNDNAQDIASDVAQSYADARQDTYGD